MPDITEIREELTAFLCGNILAKGVEFDENVRLSSVGIDSLSLVEILLFIERRFGVSLPDSHLTRSNLETVSALAECIDRLLSEKNQHCPKQK